MRTAYRDALRLLFIIEAAGIPFTDPDNSSVVAILRSESRLLALDFWMRNPDYLAGELIDLYEKSGQQDWLNAAAAIFQAEEPDLRRVPMIRYFFGAYERLDDALAILRSRDLIRITGRKTQNNKVLETDFLLTAQGRQTCHLAGQQEPVLTWYSDRAALVAQVAGNRGGAALKALQYQRASYAETALGGVIPSITLEIQAQLQQLLHSNKAHP
jgi:hypothetical protein